MNILSGNGFNFGSYRSISFDFSNQGLTLIEGENGSGKSTIPDFVFWTLFGLDSKESASDDVKMWNSEEPTTGSILVDTPSGIIQINRIRGKPSENDLYYKEMKDLSSTFVRGKNLNDTQQLINSRLGADSALYLNCSYFHQFSTAETFFISKNSERRVLFENLVNQKVAIELENKVSEERKKVKKNLELLNKQLASISGQLITSNDHLLDTEKRSKNWEYLKESNLKDISQKYENFESDKNDKISRLSKDIDKLVYSVTAPSIFEEMLQDTKDQLNSIQSEKLICPTCNSLVGKDKKTSKKEEDLLLQKESIQKLQSENLQLLSKIENLKIKLKNITESENNYYLQLEEIKNQLNPFHSQIEKIENNIKRLNESLKQNELEISNFSHKKSLLDLLYNFSYELRGKVLNEFIKELEFTTNKYLDNYFDSEIKVGFFLKESDKLDVEIQVNGNYCSYRRLSGGQRCMLKLAFWLASKKAAENKAGVSFNLLTFDETFSWLSDEFKEKAFNLLQSLEKEHSTILVIDHSLSFKSLFTNVYKVEKVGDESIITHLG